MADVYLICEGPTTGLDLRVLNLVIAQKLGKDVSINAAGGDTSLGSVATWLEERSRRPLKNGSLGPAIDRAYSIRLRADSIARGRLLEDVGGHELMSALLSHMNRSGIAHISLSLLESELIKALDHEYILGYFEPDDFVGLANRLV